MFLSLVQLSLSALQHKESDARETGSYTPSLFLSMPMLAHSTSLLTKTLTIHSNMLWSVCSQAFYSSDVHKECRPKPVCQRQNQYYNSEQPNLSPYTEPLGQSGKRHSLLANLTLWSALQIPLTVILCRARLGRD